MKEWVKSLAAGFVIFLLLYEIYIVLWLISG